MSQIGHGRRGQTVCQLMAPWLKLAKTHAVRLRASRDLLIPGGIIQRSSRCRRRRITHSQPTQLCSSQGRGEGVTKVAPTANGIGEGFQVRLPLSEHQREHLRGVREAQLADWRAGRPLVVDEMFVTDEVVRLMSGMGRACYIGLDGTVWVGNLGEGELPVALADPKDVASCVVRWSACVGLPGLVDALPYAPEGSVDCPLCKGTREMPGWVSDREDGFRCYCKKCSGLGWVAPA